MTSPDGFRIKRATQGNAIPPVLKKDNKKIKRENGVRNTNQKRFYIRMRERAQNEKVSILKIASKGFVCTKKLTNASTKKYIVYVQIS